MLDNIRYTLEKARTTLTNGWTKGSFFDHDEDLANSQGFSVCLAGGVMAALDLMESDEEDLWRNPSARGAIEALYTHIPIRSKARRAAEKELIEHISTVAHHDPVQHIMNQMRQDSSEFYEQRKNWTSNDLQRYGGNLSPNSYEGLFSMLCEQYLMPDHSEGECKICYNTMLGAITSWNDLNSRKKHEVLDLVDASIKDTIKKMEAI